MSHAVMAQKGVAELHVIVNGVTSPCWDGAAGYSRTPIWFWVAPVMSALVAHPVAGVRVIEPVAEVL